ncbi:MAG: DNA recombination protein RmuC [Bacteroidetes bacterium]|nr:DNA recombination protein RmuC [Bacteroidota bacterium]MBU1371198.1 DNA recombination protein RmuC [Bacteroidota bacterium]MBU1483775.1 DNA recombination protein RmuC [Bacteroidota bacterium]MBU1760777.1 DNA recombination protein RmuC [Bacteroidota bacterium]MBU2268743.1 DNA recombination protein RmuC [Bacteroidota bacterium]
MDMALIIVAVVILVIAVVLFLKRPVSASGIDISEFNQLKAAQENLRIQLAVSEQKVKSALDEKFDIEVKLNQRLEKLELERNNLIEQLTNEKKRMSQAEESFKAQRERLQDQKVFLEESQIRLKTEFENVANQILKAKTAEFTETNKTNLDILLNPLKENIKAFEQKVDNTYKAEAAERFTLKGTIDELIKQTKLIQDDATNLTKALKGDNKKQGNWGEMVLDKLLEGSGLIEGTNYSKQSNFTADDGSRLLPDVVIYLPEDKHIVIDSKVSLVAYEKLVNAENDVEREGFIKQHINSIKNHIVGLSAKNYHDLYQINSPEFVLLFVPIESSFAIAVQHDLDLFDFAWNKRVVIVTPSTLLATLKTVASIWKQEQQTKNAIDIATKAGQLYDKFVGFIADLQKVGDTLDKSQKAYGDAMGKLTTGSGNLVNRVETLRKLGAKATKEIDGKLLEE